jgi:hypothetical protein
MFIAPVAAAAPGNLKESDCFQTGCRPWPAPGARRIRRVAKAGYENVTIDAGAQTTYRVGFA